MPGNKGFRLIAEHYLMYFVIPVWIGAGIADWACHRQTQIATSSGWIESLIHLMMLCEVGIPLVLALFCEINALLFAVMLSAWLMHEMTAFTDLRYASSRRTISPVEQHVHSYLGLLPLLALSLLIVTHSDQFLALFGSGGQASDWVLRWKTHPLPRWYLTLLIAAIVCLEALPYLEELLRCVRPRQLEAPSAALRSDRGAG